jgi:hypothetical protein
MSLVSIYTTLASSAALKVPDVEFMAGLAKEGGALRHNSFSSVVANSMLFCLQYNAHWVLASMVMTPPGLGILRLR